MTDDPTPLEQLHKDERRAVYIEASAKLIVPAAVILTLVFVIAGSILWYDAYQRSEDNRAMAEENRALIDRITRLEKLDRAERARVRQNFRRTDVLNCRDIEQLKAGFRREALRNFRQLDENARLLGIVVTDELREVARANLRRTLRRHAARDCGELPSLARS